MDMSKTNQKSSEFEATEKFLLGLEKFGIKMGLDNIRALMAFSENPHMRLKSIHIAGTNGKGSTCAMLSSVLQSASMKVGLYTSPHIVSLTERIKVNGKEISRSELVSLVDYFKEKILELRATFFEAITAIAFKYFADQEVDIAVIETGLGGRLDATNVVQPLVSVITSIGLDHTEILGNTLEKIAFEKAGIIKQGVPVVVNAKGKNVKDVFSKVAQEKASPIYFVDEVSSLRRSSAKLNEIILDVSIFAHEYANVHVGLGGQFQVSNAITVLVTIGVLLRLGIDIPREAVYSGLHDVRKNVNHKGRLEVISENPLILLDVGHNPDAMSILLPSLEPIIAGRKGVLLFGAMSDKDVKTMLKTLAPVFEYVVLTQISTERSLTSHELKLISESIKLNAEIFSDSSKALSEAIRKIKKNGFLLITGSHYLAGEIMPLLQSMHLTIGRQ
ncbi:MAG: bifunctional folylpolyglutamate synthase/dihydrofolate synthase [Candidatus Kryptoniota bacterium]